MTELAKAPAHGERLLYTAKTHTAGGRENGRSRSSDGRLDIKLSTPGGRHRERSVAIQGRRR
jgi:organic hydroperoxide reductase OsmC/OhrA